MIKYYFQHTGKITFFFVTRNKLVLKFYYFKKKNGNFFADTQKSLTWKSFSILLYAGNFKYCIQENGNYNQLNWLGLVTKVNNQSNHNDSCWLNYTLLALITNLIAQFSLLYQFANNRPTKIRGHSANCYICKLTPTVINNTLLYIMQFFYVK